MGTTAKAYGNFNFDNLPGFGLGAGFRLPFGTIIPYGSRVSFVRSTGAQDGDPPELNGRLLPTLAAGLSECRSGLNDFVFLLPGHSESVADATTTFAGLLAGTNVIGLGKGSNQPVFRWTAAASQLAISVNDVMFAGCRFRCEGFNGVTKAIAVTGTGVAFIDNDFEASSGAANLATILLEVGTGGAASNDFRFWKNRVRGVAAGVCTNGILVSGAAANINISDNDLLFAAVSATGLINVNAAALDGIISNNNMRNVAAASITAISFGAQASSGIMRDCRISVQSTGAQTAGTTGITTGATTLYSFSQNAITNDPRTNGVFISPAADT